MKFILFQAEVFSVWRFSLGHVGTEKKNPRGTVYSAKLRSDDRKAAVKVSNRSKAPGEEISGSPLTMLQLSQF